MTFTSQTTALTAWYLTHCSAVYSAVILSLLYILVTLMVNSQARKRAHMPLSSHTYLELTWTWIPILYILGTTGSSLVALYTLEATAGHTSTTVANVVAQQWSWSVSQQSSVRVVTETCRGVSQGYNQVTAAQGIKSGNNMACGTPRLTLSQQPLFLLSAAVTTVIATSIDVIHGFSVPLLGTKADCIPGRTTVLDMHSYLEGAYTGLCSELCGVGHAFMPVTIIVAEALTSLPLSDPAAPAAGTSPIIRATYPNPYRILLSARNGQLNQSHLTWIAFLHNNAECFPFTNWQITQLHPELRRNVLEQKYLQHLADIFRIPVIQPGEGMGILAEVQADHNRQCANIHYQRRLTDPLYALHTPDTSLLRGRDSMLPVLRLYALANNALLQDRLGWLQPEPEIDTNTSQYSVTSSEGVYEFGQLAPADWVSIIDCA